MENSEQQIISVTIKSDTNYLRISNAVSDWTSDSAVGIYQLNNSRPSNCKTEKYIKL